MGGAFGQFVIKFKIPSAEEADERVTNGPAIETGRPRVRHVTPNKQEDGTRASRAVPPWRRARVI